MDLPVELRLAIAEHICEDFFTRLTRGLLPPFFKNGESKLPYTQDLLTVLQTNRTFRLDSIDLCARLATRSTEEVVRLPARRSDPTNDSSEHTLQAARTTKVEAQEDPRDTAESETEHGRFPVEYWYSRASAHGSLFT
ncbi:hypothetical protein MBLNU13_g01950t2 [Cladosporium sp. NU13]